MIFRFSAYSHFKLFHKGIYIDGIKDKINKSINSYVNLPRQTDLVIFFFYCLKTNIPTTVISPQNYKTKYLDLGLPQLVRIALNNSRSVLY